MFNQTTEGPIITGAMILEQCQSHELVRYAIPEGYELLLPRFRLETKRAMDGGKANELHHWGVECWWRSTETGTLGYFVKIDLLTKSVREFRELPGDVAVPGMNFGAAEMAYLDHFGISWKIGPKSKEAADILDELWKARVPEELREYALQNQEEHTIGSYLLPVDSLSCWNWETLRDMLLKREGTTVERILDYIEYKKSGSDKLYIAPEQRAEAKERGMKFWRDEDDI